MSYGDEAYLFFLVLAVAFSFFAYHMSQEGADVVVPECDHPATFYARSGDDSNTVRIVLQLEYRGWSNITVSEHLSDTIRAECII